MNSKLINGVLMAAGLALASTSALASASYDPEARAMERCMASITRDVDGHRLRYHGGMWVERKADGRRVVYGNARAMGQGATAERRVSCETNASGRRVIASTVEVGRFVGGTA